MRQKSGNESLKALIGKCCANSFESVELCAINKWLKPKVPEGCVIRSFRHLMRDRLRVVECPSEIIDAIGGWTATGAGQNYCLDQRLEVKLSE